MAAPPPQTSYLTPRARDDGAATKRTASSERVQRPIRRESVSHGYRKPRGDPGSEQVSSKRLDTARPSSEDDASSHKYGIDLSCERGMIVYDTDCKGERGRGAARIREYTYSWLASKTSAYAECSDVVSLQHDNNKTIRSEGELESMRMQFRC